MATLLIEWGSETNTASRAVIVEVEGEESRNANLAIEFVLDDS
jgi:hypothetical protein